MAVNLDENDYRYQDSETQIGKLGVWDPIKVLEQARRLFLVLWRHYDDSSGHYWDGRLA